MCVFKSPDHSNPLVLLTTHRADRPKVGSQVLGMPPPFGSSARAGRWTRHRLIEVELTLECIRALTWTRLTDLVAECWTVTGAIAAFCERPTAEEALQSFELRGQRLIKPLERGQFWGYAIVAGLRASPEAVRRALALLTDFWATPPPDRQPSLSGGPA